MKKTFKGKAQTAAVVLALATILGGNTTLAQAVDPLPTYQSAKASNEVRIAASSGFNYSAETLEALDYLNSIREKAGITKVALNPFITKAAENHVNYLISNSTTGHDEISGRGGFTGGTPEDRVKATGLSLNRSDSVSEVVAYRSSAISSIDNLMYVPLHRTVLLDPYAAEIGAFLKSSNFVVNVLSHNGVAKNVHYPLSGQTNVGLEFVGKTENPNPLEQFGVAKTGFVISFQTPEVISSSAKDYSTTTIKDSKGTSIPYYFGTYYGAILLFPKATLSPFETYTVSIDYKSLVNNPNNQVLNETWSFTTGDGKTTTTEPTTPPTPVNNDLPDPKPISLPSGGYNSEGEYIARAPYTAGNVGIGINGKIVSITPSARILNGSTFIPLRGVFENVGATVKWNESDRSIDIERNGTKVHLQIGNKTAQVNGTSYQLETAPFISEEGSTFVPLRFISETIGAKVGWDATNYVALIVTQK